jgi:DSF synthase
MRSSSSLAVHLDHKGRLWEEMLEPIFFPELLHDMTKVIDDVEEQWKYAPETAPKVLVTCGGTPGIFNLGGDLALFLQHIDEHDLKGLLEYALVCARGQARRIELSRHVTTVALIEGTVLGGGFELALACKKTIATADSKFGLPECLFGLFPFAGAYSILTRKVGQARADRLVSSGRVYSAQEMADWGVISAVVPTGTSRADMLAVALSKKEVSGRDAHRQQHLKELSACVQNSYPTRRELEGIARLWAETAYTLGKDDRRKIAHLVYAQSKRLQQAA